MSNIESNVDSGSHSNVNFGAQSKIGFGTQDEDLAALVKQLPWKLRIGLNVDALKVAIAENVIGIADGKLKWNLENKTLLAYFCGRMWCGDTCIYNNKKGIWRWKQGKRDFPQKDLESLFGEKGLWDLRRHRNLCPPPFGFEKIDHFFEQTRISLGYTFQKNAV